ncbi:hypothetical protein MY9_2327 [Bacillus sp. JS]|nr:hypothetical protein MY9_2327 [Bacillus sp. JS]
MNKRLFFFIVHCPLPPIADPFNYIIASSFLISYFLKVM